METSQVPAGDIFLKDNILFKECGGMINYSTIVDTEKRF